MLCFSTLSFHIRTMNALSVPYSDIRAFFLAPTFARGVFLIGFVDGLSGVLLSGFGVFFGVGVGLEKGITFHWVSFGYSFDHVFSFFGFTSFSFFSFAAIVGENFSHAFQLPFGISGSFFGNAVIIVRVMKYSSFYTCPSRSFSFCSLSAIICSYLLISFTDRNSM